VAWLSGFDGSSDLWTFWIFQAVFVSTAATIVSGAVAERTKFMGYLCYTILIAAVIYPVLGHWAWAGLASGLVDGFGGGQGWLEKRGFVDFAGSTVVYGVGGLCSGRSGRDWSPTGGRFASDGTPILIPRHNIPLVALGTLILIFG